MLVSRSARNFLHFWSNTKSRVSVVVVVFFFLRCSPNTNFQLTAPFRDPVDWKAWKLFDYPKLIKHSMDMATVQVRETLRSPLILRTEKQNHHQTTEQTQRWKIQRYTRMGWRYAFDMDELQNVQSRRVRVLQVGVEIFENVWAKVCKDSRLRQRSWKH